MATKTDKTDITTKTARARLRVQNTIYWRALKPGKLHLGYAKRKAGEAGVWIMRTYLGVDAQGIGRHQKQNIGTADDMVQADGTDVMSYVQAQQRTLDLHGQRQKADPATSTDPLTVQGVTDAYLAHLKAHGQSAADAARRIRTHILPGLSSGTKVEDLTTQKLVQWRDGMAAEPARLRTAKGKQQRFREAPLSPEEKRARRATVNRTVTVLKAALNRAFEHGRVHDDLAWRRLKPFGKTEARRPGFLSVEGCNRLVDAADAASGFRNVARAALYTGARYSELCRLKVSDFERGRIVIHLSKSGKGRDIRLMPDAIVFFTQLCAARKADETMLLRADGSPWGPSHQSRPMLAACEAARIQPPVGIHQLRHSWASLSVMAGMPLLLVAENLGHTDSRMVEKFYGHLTDDYRDAMFERHAPRFGETPKINVVQLREAQ